MQTNPAPNLHRTIYLVYVLIGILVIVWSVAFINRKYGAGILMLLSGSVQHFLAKIWLGSLIALMILFLISVEIAISGWPLMYFMDAKTAVSNLYTISYIMLGLMALCILAGFAYNIQN